ncbi:hypothetical protein P153DRAFT_371139 [Dothidotthia symphoricarpi CBS 119687]|uniref:RING-type E3 ubiquitin transferase n=1 Tax=Dothidotthia symphoricarpi CBS 119687 TaxID=1392245 RepID=A0A6A5ZZG8_9PLEO|nr:uncharacterized protein P153DRAFT_371139 [Dothidotthia symphoricarpi CBS 119687]KAF2124283.1 hypothetical protein P153DRAFT_371139 [Dothidotthia symphoricarpi CBS 119687]
MATEAMAADAGPFDAADDLLTEAESDSPHNTPSSSSVMADEADTCRICRGEGTAKEPLFHPCKCNGSIKFVHQECLMEWLSHTQKKHCELCKTSFRFTKLYDPRMPNRIPTAVFMRRAALHVVKMLLTWCRAVLVGSVWMVLLPWCMRVVWRSLFWVGDGGWTRDGYLEPADNTDTSPLSSLDLEVVRAALEAAKANRSQNWVVMSLFKGSKPLVLNGTLVESASESPFWDFAKRLLFGIPYPAPSLTPSLTNQTELNATSPLLTTRHPSLLSDIPWFNRFESQTVNRFIIDVFEGLMITLLVVVAFILIFLIREWVVQQQPVINMVALNNNAAANPAANNEDDGDLHAAAEENEGEEDNEDVNPDAQQVVGDDVDVDSDLATAIDNPFVNDDSTQPEFNSEMAQDNGQRTVALDHVVQNGTGEDMRRASEEMSEEDKERLARATDNIYPNPEQIADHTYNKTPESAATEPRVPTPSSSAPLTRSSSLPQNSRSASGVVESDPSGAFQRPNMPSRNQSFIATEIRRSLEEGTSWSFDNVQQASGDEDRPDENTPDSWEDEDTEDGPPGQEQEMASIQEPDSERSSGSWQQVTNVNVEETSDQALERGRPQEPSEAEAVLHHFLRAPSEDGRSNATFETTAEPTSEVDFASDESEHGSDALPEQPELEDPEHQLPAEAAAPLAQVQNQQLEPAGPQQPLPPPLTRFLDWVYGDVAPEVQPPEEVANDEHIVRNLAEEPPFVAFAGNDVQEPVNPPVQDREVAAAVAQAAIDVNEQDAIEDAEDLEGILELIGMQGPLIGLFQNALFSAVLISATLACAVWVPYLWGKFMILLMGSPVAFLVKLPLQTIAAVTDFVVDTTLFFGGASIYWISRFISMLVTLSTWGTLSGSVDGPLSTISGPAHSVAYNALERLGKMLAGSALSPGPDYFQFNADSHMALRSLQNTTSFALNETSNFIGAVFEEIAAESPFGLVFRALGQLPHFIQVGLAALLYECNALLSWISSSKSYKLTFDLDLGQNTTAAYTSVERWTASDRTIAIFAGYASFAMGGAIYLKRATPFSTSQQGQRIERVFSEVLQQAGGVLKVILIISIEMLAFPLYCGLLLDLAMLPLFKDATLYTRWQFACESPWTSCFVHWFIGTCYMFHFALFVSMCRKIMRKGVLYFIRDPDDPTFHPVRDVLERSVTTQLRKIGFSALVYGALVIVCLGGVVWSLNRATSGVLPIHWTTEAPFLEFPLDLLFYNFLTPVIIKFYKPSEGLHAVYQWWFKKCAGFLRLSNFLFGDKNKEEEGYHVTWTGWLKSAKQTPEQAADSDEDGRALVPFVNDGKYVRAPASDQARIPKGHPVFVEVDRNNVRKDGITEGGVHNTDLVNMVYIPPWFRVRIACFVFTIWVFMGVTGISVTIIPLLVGRYLFSLFLPSTVEMNDIHAFSLGVYSLGSIAYSGYQVHKFIASLNQPVPSPLSALHTVAATTSRVGMRVLRFSFVWTSLIFAIPFLFAVLIELYFLMPLHAYLGPTEPHVVHLIQDWTLGFLYSRLAARIVFANRNSRPARAFNAVIRDGYLHPNARIATRCFLLPVLALFAIAIAVPSSFAFVMSRTMYAGASEAVKGQVWRFCFPAIGLSAAGMWVGKEVIRMLTRWRLVVRDEVYLIGERLHNFGERRAPVQSPVAESLVV